MSERYVLTARLMFTDRDAAQRAADRIEQAAGDAIATEYVIEDIDAGDQCCQCSQCSRRVPDVAFSFEDAVCDDCVRSNAGLGGAGT